MARPEPPAIDAPHSWETEDHQPEDLRQPDEQAADDAGARPGDF